GTLADGVPQSTTQPLSAGGVRWFSFSLATGIDGTSPSPRTYLDIDTEGSVIGDTTIALYRADGTLVAGDDDSGSATLSQLSFGRGTRPPVSDGLPYDGRNGNTLAAGTYFIAVAEHPVIFGSSFTVICTGGTDANDITVNIRRGVQSPIVCGPITSSIDGHA